MKAISSISLMVAAAAAILALSVPVSAFSQMTDMSMKESMKGHGQIKMCNMDKMGDMMGMCIKHADKMGLADDQLMKMKLVDKEIQKKQAQFEADLKIAEIEFMEIMEVKDFDIEKAGSAVKKIADIKTAHHLETLKAMKEMRAILTDEQFKKMKKMMSMMKGGGKPAKRMMKK